MGQGKDICEALYVLGESGRDVFKERTFGKAETKITFLGIMFRVTVQDSNSDIHTCLGF